MVAIHAKAPAARSSLPGIVIAVGAVALVGGYVRYQLQRNSNNMNRSFAQYRNPESEAQRVKDFQGFHDPRRTPFNFLDRW